MTRIILQISVVFLLSIPAYARLKSEVSLSKPYWLNYSLIFLEGGPPKVFPNNIVFTEEDNVNPSSGRIFSRGTKIKIYSVSMGKRFARIRFGYWPIFELKSEYEVLLDKRSMSNFRKSFKLLFSARNVSPDYHCPADIKTKKQVIECLGFPISVTREGSTENYFYYGEFIGPNPFAPYDAFTIKIRKGKVVSVSGII